MDEALLESTKELFNIYFELRGKPAGDELVPGQLEIASAILFKVKPRVAVLAPTGYGKSESVSMAALLSAAKNDEEWIIAAYKKDTAQLIMNGVIDHIFDNDELVKELEIDSSQRLTQLKRERSKEKINFRGGGSLKIVSLWGKDDDVSKTIGEHKPNIILDESPLLSATKYMMVKKILEGTGDYDSTFMLELGNAIGRNHFMKNVKTSSSYYSVDISLQQAINEGRLDERSVEEQREAPFFKEFYLCQFPDENEIDERGFRQLLTTDDILAKFIDEIEPMDDPMLLGNDVARGGDWNVYAIRQENYGWFEGSNRSQDTMTNVSEIQRIIDKYTFSDTQNRAIQLLKPTGVFIDDIGIGGGVTDRLKEKGLKVNGVAVGGAPAKEKGSDIYENLKAQAYWKVRQWILSPETRLLRNDKWLQLTEIKYKINSDKKIQIEPKEDLKARTGHSPDFAEAFMLTFVLPKHAEVRIRSV